MFPQDVQHDSQGSSVGARSNAQPIARDKKQLYRRRAAGRCRIRCNQSESHRLMAGKSLAPVVESLIAEAAIPAKDTHRKPALLLLPDQFCPLLLTRRARLDSPHPFHYRTRPCSGTRGVHIALTPALYATILNQAFGLPIGRQATSAQLEAADLSTIRLVKKAEAFFRTLPPEVPEFDHFTPAAWLFQNLGMLESGDDDVTQTLARAETVINAVNSLLQAA